MRLPNSRYEEIKSAAVDMLELVGADSIPVDPFAIAEKLGIKTIAYSDLGEDGKEAALKLSENGFRWELETDDGEETDYVYYNDEHPIGRVRFTLLHEIGHIVLGHQQESEVAEAEANFFAKFTIAPPSLVCVIRPNDYVDIASAFDLSQECAFNSWNYYRSWLHVKEKPEYEQTLQRLFVIGEAKGGEAMLRMERGA